VAVADGTATEEVLAFNLPHAKTFSSRTLSQAITPWLGRPREDKQFGILRRIDFRTLAF
jgi:hypothetical protein